MDNHQHHHGDLMDSVAETYQELLDNSEQGVYIYLDDNHKVCNKKFATLLGYKSEEEWAQVEESFPDVFVAEKSQQTIVSAFQDAMEKMVGSMSSIEWKKKDGGTVNTKVILVPIIFDNHLFALHFVTNK